jgi:hypothetical protein
MDNTLIIEGYVPPDGRIEDTTSYRTEVCGTIAVLTFYGMIQSVHKWNDSTIKHVCDNESALDHIWNKEKYDIFDQSRPDADAITVVRELFSTTKHTTISPLGLQTPTLCDVNLSMHPFPHQFNLITEQL